MKEFDDTEIAFRGKSNFELRKAYWLFNFMAKPTWVNAGAKLISFSLKTNLPIKWILKPTVFQQFCGGETINECKATIEKLAKSNIGTILDYSIEGKESEEDFIKCHNEIIKTIELAAEQSSIPFTVVKLTGIARFDLLEKLSSKDELNLQERQEYISVLQRFENICRAASHHQVRLFVDAEKSWIQDAIDQMVTSMMAQFNKKSAIIFNTVQLYRHDRLDFLKKSFVTAKNQGFIYGVKLVRGAYMEIENERAQNIGYTSPIQKNKWSCDNDFDEAVHFCFENREHLSFCMGSHNEASTVKLMQLMHDNQVPKNHPNISFAQLYGMSNQITYTLANEGFNVAKYVPFGPVKDVIPYLIRRAQENTSVAGQTPRELQLLKNEIKRRKKKG